MNIYVHMMMLILIASLPHSAKRSLPKRQLFRPKSRGCARLR